MPSTLRSSTRKPSPSSLAAVPEHLRMEYDLALSAPKAKAGFLERERAHHALVGKREARARSWVDPMRSWVTRTQLWFEVTFALSMLEPWEKLLVVSLCFFLFSLLTIGIYRYLPFHLQFISRRARFYILGDESAPLKEVMVLVGAKWAGGV